LAAYNPDGAGYSGNSAALQADGKIVMVGPRASTSISFRVIRFNADGTIDTTFGSNGMVIASFGNVQYETAREIAVQADGKIIIGGDARFLNPVSLDMAVLRLNSDGSVDTSFGSSGVKMINFTNFSGIPYGSFLGAMKIAGDGKIVVVGSSQGLNVDQHASLARLNPDGSLDTTFSGDGRVLAGGFYWYDVTILPDNSIITAGYISQPWIANTMYASKFSNTGAQLWIYTRGETGVIAYLFGVEAQPDGKVIVVGQYNNKVTVMRLDANGNLDPSFNTDTETISGRANTVALQNDGKVLVSTGYTLFRFNTDGSRDRGFGINGLVSSPSSGSSIIVQPDEKILVTGSSVVTPPGGSHFSVARFKGGASAPVKTPFDYDDDGKSDISVFRPSENKWFILKSSDSSVAQPIFGASGDIPTPADFDGDGKTDPAVFRPSTGVWWYLSSVNGNQIAAQWGQSGDIPRPSDFDGDGKSDFIVYRPADNKWYRLGSTGTSSIVAFGSAGDKPLIGDFDGDGKSDPAIYRPSTGAWWYAASSLSGAHRAVQFGISTDTPVPADFDGDGKTDFAVYRPSNGVWHILQSSNNNYIAYQFGITEDKPVAADYDGDGKADKAVFRPSNGSWYQMRSTAGFVGAQWGASTDIPTQNAFIQ
jgi:uncharacterized delta-60 repeat protein